MDLDGIHNIRDLGGHPLAGGGETARGRVLRACAMTGLSPAGREALLARGLSRIVDLRGIEEAAADPSPFAGMVEHVALPLFDGLATAAAMADGRADFDLADRYQAALAANAPRFAEAVTAVAEAPAGVVVFHCTAGKDRTGLIAALMLSLAGVPAPVIAADYGHTAEAGKALLGRLREKAEARGAAGPWLDLVLGCPPQTMARTLDWLAATHGDARGFLTAAGAAPATLDRAASRLG